MEWMAPRVALTGPGTGASLPASHFSKGESRWIKVNQGKSSQKKYIFCPAMTITYQCQWAKNADENHPGQSQSNQKERFDRGFPLH
jgi:hypothetical protein